MSLIWCRATQKHKTPTNCLDCGRKLDYVKRINAEDSRRVCKLAQSSQEENWPFLLTSIRTGCWSPPRKWAPLRTSGRKRPLSGTQHNFHDTKRETLKRARPQVVTSRDNRLTDTSVGRETERRTVNTTSVREKHCRWWDLATQRGQTVFIQKAEWQRKALVWHHWQIMSTLRKKGDKTVNMKSLLCWK